MITAYPLSWPDGWPRTPVQQRKRAKFSRSERKYSSAPGGGSWVTHKQLSVADATERVLQELDRLGVAVGNEIMSTNLLLRLDGYPRSNQAEPSDPGVAVYWQGRGESDRKVMAIDLYDRVADNLAAIAATLEAMRSIERHGGAQILDRAFQGFLALPAPGTTSLGWRDVLGVGTEETSLAAARRAFRARAKQCHPDFGGRHDDMVNLNIAMKQAEEALS